LINHVQVGVDLTGQVVDHLHVAAHLSRDLLQHLFCKVTPRDRLLEAHELNNIAPSFYIFVISQKLIIRIKLHHHWELFAANPNNDDRAGEFGSFDDHFLCLAHIVNFSIGQNQQDEVGLEFAALHRKVHEHVHN